MATKIKKAFKESDLEINSKYPTIVGGIEPRMMAYGGEINAQDEFMYEIGGDLIISWESHGKPRFSEDGEVTLAYFSLKIYESGSKEYNDRIKIIRRERK